MRDYCRARDPETNDYCNDGYHIIETELGNRKLNCLFCGVWFVKTVDGDWKRAQ